MGVFLLVEFKVANYFIITWTEGGGGRFWECMYENAHQIQILHYFLFSFNRSELFQQFNNMYRKIGKMLRRRYLYAFMYENASLKFKFTYFFSASILMWKKTTRDEVLG